MGSRYVDLLLLNASNYPGQPIYPYAFIQVSALARQHGLSVKRYDFLGTQKSERLDVIEHLISTYRPRMVGFHVRQADSQVVSEYSRIHSDAADENDYFPVDDTKDLLLSVRKLTDAPIVVGGFGFTVHAKRMVTFLAPDYGIAGEPDAFFQFFDKLAARDLSSVDQISNLIYKSDNLHKCSPRVAFPPLAKGEYDDEVFYELCAFYAKQGRRLSLGRIGEVDVPVELMRGCPCQCYFCTEPSVKGKRILQRDLDAVMEDIEFLASRDVRSVWFVCSEINMSGMEFPLRVAARMKQLNSRLGKRRMLWKAYAMPRPGMSRVDIRSMMLAGYVPGWNEFTSLDDTNLKACKMPYRAEHLIRYFKDVMELSNDTSVYFGPPLQRFEMFLGNAFMNAKSMRTTLEIIDREELCRSQIFGGAALATRIYPFHDKKNPELMDGAFTIRPSGVAGGKDTLYPTFKYAHELVNILGSREGLEAFLSFVSRTFLSCSYKHSLDMLGFSIANISALRLAEHLATHSLLGQIITMQVVAARLERVRSGLARDLLAESGDLAEGIWRNPTELRVKELSDPTRATFVVRAATMALLLEVLVKINEGKFSLILRELGLADSVERETTYRIMRRLYQKFSSIENIIATITETLGLSGDSLQVFHLKYFLFVNNVRIDSRYKSLLFESIPTS